jgi:hypothetical protein
MRVSRLPACPCTVLFFPGCHEFQVRDIGKMDFFENVGPCVSLRGRKWIIFVRSKTTFSSRPVVRVAGNAIIQAGGLFRSSSSQSVHMLQARPRTEPAVLHHAHVRVRERNRFIGTCLIAERAPCPIRPSHPSTWIGHARCKQVRQE